MNTVNMKSNVENVNEFKAKLVEKIWKRYPLNRGVCEDIVDCAWNSKHLEGTKAVTDAAYKLAEIAE